MDPKWIPGQCDTLRPNPAVFKECTLWGYSRWRCEDKVIKWHEPKGPRLGFRNRSQGVGLGKAREKKQV